MTLNEKENVGWIDLLRVVACLLVVFSHSCDPFVAHFDANREMFVTGVFAGSLVRPCVSLFAMMTAVLLLPIKTGTTVNEFYKKRIGRIIKPLIFWSLALPLMAFCYFTAISPDTTNPQLSVDDYTTTTLVQRLYTFVFNFNFDTIPLWYLYMLIGLYLIMPIISSWLAQATQKDIKTVLYIWGATLFLPYVKMVAPVLGYAGNYGHMGLFGECDWNVYGSFYYVSGFIGYLILAYYLKKYPLDWSWKKMAVICVPMFALGYAVTSVGYIITNDYFPGNYAYLEIMWLFTSINVFMMTFPVFVAVRKIGFRPSAFISALARLTFGIYLCHFFVVQVMYDVYNALVPSLPAVLKMILMAVSAFSISALLVWIISRIPLLRRVVA